MTLQFDNSYIKLPDRFYAHQLPVPVSAPELIRVNHALARQLGISATWLESREGIAMVAGNHIPEGAAPIAAVYAGHQFGSWNPRLGDGRAILLGEVIGEDGERYDLQLKGSGITPYSRSGDGRAPLGPILREYLVSEAMAALGVATSRTLAAVTSGELVYREQRLQGAVLMRVAKSHIRIGTLQYFASIGDFDGLRLLVDHVIERHYPEAATADNPVLAMYQRVADRQAELMAHWQSIGFIHGVMNTDNMLLSGETIDFGPCAFMDGYDSAAVYSAIDHAGRYAFQNQPGIAQWNLARLGQSLLPLLSEDEAESLRLAQAVVDGFVERYMAAWSARLRAKLGLATVEEQDDVLAQDFLGLMESGRHDFTLGFRRLCDLADEQATPEADPQAVIELFDFPPAFAQWLQRWRQRTSRETITPARRQQTMRAVNPIYIPRNHRIEQAIEQAYAGEFSLFHRLLDGWQSPFEFDPAYQDLAAPPQSHEMVHQTFCGT